MHDWLRQQTAVDDIAVCYDTADRPTQRRKPGPGMLLELAARWYIDLPGSYMIGDRHSDIEAGSAAGCLALFIDRGSTAETRPTRHGIGQRAGRERGSEDG